MSHTLRLVIALLILPALARCADDGGTPAATCGDGVVLGTEGCVEPTCGDGVITGVEQCDGAALDGKSCADFGGGTGTLGCTSRCTYDSTQCVAPGCPNGIRDAGEDCDGDDLGGATCESRGFAGGDLGCLASCAFEESSCVEAGCGNGLVEAGESCEYTDDAVLLGASTCATLGFADTSGLGCDPVTCAFDTSGCEADLPLAGFGAIMGDCDVIDTELSEVGPSFFVNHIDFGADPYDDADADLLTPGSRKIIADGNAGGSSLFSEIFAYEMLARCELATLLKTETEIAYDGPGKITDLLVTMDGEKVGVSVTRAVGFPFDAPYTAEQATALLEKKLGDIPLSTGHVSEGDRWVKQILHVIAYADGHAATIEAAWEALDAGLKGDTIVIVTVSDGDDAFLY